LFKIGLTQNELRSSFNI